MPIDPAMLYPRRLAARALSLVLDDFGLSSICVRPNPDDPSECFPGPAAGEVVFGENLMFRMKPIASVTLDDASRARVIIERIELLIRTNHLADFEARDYGILQRAGEPDIDAEIDVSSIVEMEGETMRSAPQRIRPPASRPFVPRVIRSIGGRSRG